MKGIASATALVALIGMPGAVRAQEPPAAAGADTAVVRISLDEAIHHALEESQEVKMARASVEVAEAQVTAARADALPQINLSLGYTRTLASQFDTGDGFTLPDSLRFDPDPSLPLEDRVTYLEEKVPNAAFGALGGLFSDLPFGQENAYNASITASQLLYSGGRVGAALEAADHFTESARLSLAEARAEVEQQVRTAYYQALLARETETIAEEALEQAERFLSQERLRLEAGRASELEVMRAEVSRDNLRPQLVEARNAADLAMLNLKRLLDIPLTRTVELTTPLEPPPAATRTVSAPSAVEVVEERPAVEAAERQVAIREQQVRIAKGAFLPSVSLSTAYGRQLYPASTFDFGGEWRTDWTVSIGVDIPLFQGFRRAAEVSRARAELDQARLQVEQLKESVQLDYERARAERERALSAIAARERTADVAERVYDLTVLRYEQGVATQLEVSESRLALLQARTNLAQAIADYYIADASVQRARGGSAVANRRVRSGQDSGEH
ncbi:MAG TPA: TolC family protein [Longimicrobiales bacterium]